MTEGDDPKRERLDALLGQATDLPTLPQTLVRLNQMLGDPNVSANQIGQLISLDPALAARILRIVNSAFYGFATRINTITHAIVILGDRSTRQIVLSTYVFEAFRGDPKKTAYDRSLFWKHAIGCAAACKAISRFMGSKRWEEVFIMGLLHDLGKIVLDQHLHAEFLRILDHIEERAVSMRQAELDLLGLDHTDVGRRLLERWGLSPDVVAAVGWHHRPGEAGDHRREASIVHLADILVRAMLYGYGGDPWIPEIDPEAWDTLGLSPADFDPLIREAHLEIEKASVFLELAR